MECEVKAGEVERPSGLPLVQLLGRHEVLQVLVVCPNLTLMFCAFNKVPPLLEGSDNRRLSAVRSWTSRTGVRTGPNPQVRGSGPVKSGPNLPLEVQVQGWVDRTLGVGPGSNLDRTWCTVELESKKSKSNFKIVSGDMTSQIHQAATDHHPR